MRIWTNPWSCHFWMTIQKVRLCLQFRLFCVQEGGQCGTGLVLFFHTFLKFFFEFLWAIYVMAYTCITLAHFSIHYVLIEEVLLFHLFRDDLPVLKVFILWFQIFQTFFALLVLLIIFWCWDSEFEWTRIFTQTFY